MFYSLMLYDSRRLGNTFVCVTTVYKCSRLPRTRMGNSMSIHPKKVENDTIPLQFVLNLYIIFIVFRHVKIQNFRLLPLIVFELWDFKF